MAASWSSPALAPSSAIQSELAPSRPVMCLFLHLIVQRIPDCHRTGERKNGIFLD
jgi:hypothetical protein